MTGCDIRQYGFRVQDGLGDGSLGGVLAGQGFGLSGFFQLRALPALALLCLSGCLQTASDLGSKDSPNAYDAIRRADLQPRFPQATANADTATPERQAASYYGSPVEAAVANAPPGAGGGGEGGEGFSLNFENTPVATVAKVILGDILNVGYVISPLAQGTISLSSGRPVAKSDMLFVLENALRVNNLVLVRDPVGYRILPATDGSIGSVDRGAAVEPGYGLTVIPVQYVSGATLVKLMEGFATKPGTIRTDPTGKILLVLGSGSERQTAVETVQSFDVDWLRGQSVGIYPVYNSQPATMVAELEKIMDSGDTGLGHNLVKFQAIERQNSILVVASKPELLRTASLWVKRLDKSAVASTGVKVYRVKYGDAAKIAGLLSNIFTGGGSTGLKSPSNQIAPNSGATSLSTIDRLTGGGANQETPNANAPPGAGGLGQGGLGQGHAEAAAAISTAGTLGPLGGGGGAGGPGGGSVPLPDVRITADVANNSVLIYANEEEYRIIERALAQLDRPKMQVAIDVTIAEVTLNDELDYGVQFFLSNGHGSLMNVAGTTLPITPALPGFNFVAGAAGSVKLILNALHQYTDVKILSNPSLVVVDNGEATLEVGDQVPISTGSATVLSANNAVVNTVDYKNTGIILHVKPRVNSNDTVLLDIEQEISTVPPGSSSATAPNLTPTISQRKVKSELSVADGQTVLMAGLINETQSVTHSGIPILDQIPVVGNAFSQKENSVNRTELILFIRPQVIHNGADASVVAEELRSKMRGGQLGSLGLPKLFAPQPNRTIQ